MHLSDTAKNRQAINNLVKKVSNKRVEQELPEIPGAVKRFEKLEAKVKELEKWKKGIEKRVQDLIAEKKQREMEGGRK